MLTLRCFRGSKNKNQWCKALTCYVKKTGLQNPLPPSMYWCWRLSVDFLCRKRIMCQCLLCYLMISKGVYLKTATFYLLYHRYFIDNEEDRPLFFTIGVNSGIIRTTGVLDREERAWHNITVMAAEVGKFPATAHNIKLSHCFLCATIHQQDTHLFLPPAFKQWSLHQAIHPFFPACVLKVIPTCPKLFVWVCCSFFAHLTFFSYRG